MEEPLRILFVIPEVTPFARTGGLGDVTSALPKALAALGHDVRVVMPLYQTVRDSAFLLTELLADLQVPLVIKDRGKKARSPPPRTGGVGEHWSTKGR